MRDERLPKDFNAQDVRKLQDHSEARNLLSMSTHAYEHSSDAQHRGKARGTMHHPDHSAPHIHADEGLMDKRPESFTKKHNMPVQGKVGQDVFAADVYSSNHKTAAEAQKARQLQHSIGSGDILAMHDRPAKLAPLRCERIVPTALDLWENAAHMAGESYSGVFELDEDERKSEKEASSAPSPMAEDEDEEDDYYEVTEAGSSDRGSIDPFRRAMPQIEAEEDVCSICLDAFTDDDPGNATVCGHDFHLQCIMQWAQRSRECPLCFRPLALQDSAMQELLPFGEYVPPENGGLPAAFLGFEAWDMDHLLQRLALQSGSHSRRPRTRSRTRAQSLQGPPQGAADADNTGVTSRGRGQSSSQQSIPSEEDSYPSSWPPRGMQINDGRGNGGAQSLHRLASGTDNKSAADSLKSRWTNFRSSIIPRCREQINRSTAGFKSKSDRSEQGAQAQPPH